MRPIDSKMCIALDCKNLEEVKTLLAPFKNKVQRPEYVKIGMELFYAFGSDAIRMCRDLGFKIFLDLKLHDIPNTMSESLRVLIQQYEPEMINVHALAGPKALSKVSELKIEFKKTRIIAVTILTSHDEKDFLQTTHSKSNIGELALNLAKLTQEFGLDGVVCSCQELQNIKSVLGNQFLCITPGIRYETDSNDQKRIATPEYAIKHGSDLLVLGRTLTQYSDIHGRYLEILESI